MNYIIKLVVEYQATESEYIFELLIIELKNLINYYIRKISKFYREDLYQELIYRLYRVIKKFKFKTIQNFDYSRFNSNTLNILEKSDFKNVNLLFKNKYLSGFIDKYGYDLLKNACLNESKVEEFIDEFNLFSNENQFFDYLNKSFYRETAYFYRKYHLKENNDLISLNAILVDDIEMVDTIPDNDNKSKLLNWYDLLSEEDRQFTSLFYDGKRILTGKEVAKKLGVTQQAVSSKLKRVKKRYLKKIEESNCKVEK